MNRVARTLPSFLSSRGPSGLARRGGGAGGGGGGGGGGGSLGHKQQQQQQRGITVKVNNGNVEGALQLLARKMRDSGMESLIKKKAYFDRWMCDYHVKDSTRRYVNRRKIEYRIRNQELFRTLKTLLSKKMSGH